MSASAFVNPHALVGNGVFTILKGPAHFPPIPPRDPPVIDSLVIPNFTLGWIPNDLPYLTLIPKHKPFNIFPLDRLNYSDDKLPLFHNRKEWSLRDDVITQWDTLERNLRVLLFFLSNRYYGPLPRQ